MYLIKFTSKFKKNYKLMIKRGLDIKLLDSVINELMNGNDLDGKYNDHQLKGSLAKFRECHIEPDWLLVYYIDESVLTLTLINTGSHSDIFK